MPSHADATAFEAWHRDWCAAIVDRLKESGIANVSYGRAAKLVAVTLKGNDGDYRKHSRACADDDQRATRWVPAFSASRLTSVAPIASSVRPKSFSARQLTSSVASA
jgi:hypothetical protein